jgi:hypothetical protein
MRCIQCFINLNGIFGIMSNQIHHFQSSCDGLPNEFSRLFVVVLKMFTGREAFELEKRTFVACRWMFFGQ